MVRLNSAFNTGNYLLVLVLCRLVPIQVLQRVHIGPTAPDHAVRRSVKDLGLADFTPHDLRRTAASCMTSIGIPRLVVSKILNHVEQGVTAIYDRHSYDADKRKALLRWERWLRTTLEEKKVSTKVVPLTPSVVPLDAARA